MTAPWLPKQGQAALNNTPLVFNSVWYRFFRELWHTAGFGSGANVYSDVAIPGTSLDDPGFRLSREALGANTKGAGYPWNSAEDAYFGARVPLNYKASSNITVFVEWAPTDATAGGVVWEFEYDVAGVGSATVAGASESVTGTAPGVTGQITRTTFTSGISSSAISAGRTLVCRLSRLTNDAADTYANTATVAAVVMRYEAQGIGEGFATP